MLALLFNFSQSQIVDEVRFQRTQPLTVIEKNTASILAINSGGDGSKRKLKILSRKISLLVIYQKELIIKHPVMVKPINM